MVEKMRKDGEGGVRKRVLFTRMAEDGKDHGCVQTVSLPRFGYEIMHDATVVGEGRGYDHQGVGLGPWGRVGSIQGRQADVTTRHTFISRRDCNGFHSIGVRCGRSRALTIPLRAPGDPI